MTRPVIRPVNRPPRPSAPDWTPVVTRPAAAPVRAVTPSASPWAVAPLVEWDILFLTPAEFRYQGVTKELGIHERARIEAEIAAFPGQINALTEGRLRVNCDRDTLTGTLDLDANLTAHGWERPVQWNDGTGRTHDWINGGNAQEYVRRFAPDAYDAIFLMTGATWLPVPVYGLTVPGWSFIRIGDRPFSPDEPVDDGLVHEFFHQLEGWFSSLGMPLHPLHGNAARGFLKADPVVGWRRWYHHYGTEVITDDHLRRGSPKAAPVLFNPFTAGVPVEYLDIAGIYTTPLNNRPIEPTSNGSGTARITIDVSVAPDGSIVTDITQTSVPPAPTDPDDPPVITLPVVPEPGAPVRPSRPPRKATP